MYIFILAFIYIYIYVCMFMVRWKMVKSCNYVFCCRFVDQNFESVPKNPSRRRVPFLKKDGVLKMHRTKPKAIAGHRCDGTFGGDPDSTDSGPGRIWRFSLRSWPNLIKLKYIYIRIYLYSYLHTSMNEINQRKVNENHTLMVWVDFVALTYGSFNNFSWL